jgi:hypothetical protein
VAVVAVVVVGTVVAVVVVGTVVAGHGPVVVVTIPAVGLAVGLAVDSTWISPLAL